MLRRTPAHFVLRAAEKQTFANIMNQQSASIHLLLLAMLACVALPAWGQLRILTSPAIEPALVPIVAAYRAETHSEVVLLTGGTSSVRKSGDVAGTADVLVVPAGQLGMASKKKALADEGARELGRVRLGIFVREGVTPPSVATPDALRAALLAASAIAYDNASTGRQFGTAVNAMGIAAELEIKTTRLDDVEGVLEHVRKGKSNGLGVAPVTAIIPNAAKGLKLVGPLPPEVNEGVRYSVAVLKNSKSTAAAQAFVKYLLSPATKARLAALGVE